MYDILKNLYYITLFGMLLRFVGLSAPFHVLFGISLLYLAVADVFMQDEIDRLRRMNAVGYTRRTDLSIAFVTMTACFGAYHFALGVNYRPFLSMWGFWILGAGTLAALYVYLHEYLPRGRGRRFRAL